MATTTATATATATAKTKNKPNEREQTKHWVAALVKKRSKTKLDFPQL